MKAYQLKIVIKNSKPPIWRRCIVPTGITFSQLAVILNKVMGWSGYHLSEFEFYHQEIRIAEDIDEYKVPGYDKYDVAEAESTYIREYMEGNDWFTYTYDFGDDWEHRVTIEEVIPEYPFNYPQVIKYKGACPMEDCGGIHGYYECLDIMADENHPEHAARCEWAKDQGYLPEYDMDGVNEDLKNECFLIWGKGEKRTRTEIYSDFFEGKFGLKAAKSDKNKKAPRRSKYHEMEDSMQRFAELFHNHRKKFGLDPCGDRKTLLQILEAQAEEQAAQGVLLKDILSDFERKDLAEIAQEKGMGQFAKYGKEKLVNALTKEMLKPEEAERYFACIGAEEWDAFKQAVEGDEIGEDESLFSKLYMACYVGVREDGLIIIPEDVQAVYRSMNVDQLEKKRKRFSALVDCFGAAESLYGIVPVEIMTEFFASASGEKIGRLELETMCEQIPGCYMDFVYKNGMFYHKQLYPYDRGLLEAQGNKKFYIPTGNEIRDLARNGYLPNDLYLKDFIKFLEKGMKMDRDDARYVGMLVQHEISGGSSMKEVMDILGQNSVECRNDRELEKLVAEINKLWNNTRMLLNRGYTPLEMARLVSSGPGGLAGAASKIINLADRQRGKVKKIYPNDPCPCGSGKKYKNCCGKKL